MTTFPSWCPILANLCFLTDLPRPSSDARAPPPRPRALPVRQSFPTRREHSRMNRLCTVAGLFVLAASALHAQVANNTALVGNVVDSSGGAVSGAKVTAVDESTKVTYPGTTNDQGYYSIKFIPPGTYDITIDQSGF